MFALLNFLAEGPVNGFWPWLSSGEDSDFSIFLRIGNLEIRWYAICILLGALLALFRCRMQLKKRNMPADLYDNFFLSVIPIALVGARLWYVISQPDDFIYKGDFWKSLLAIIGYSDGKFELTGLAVQGGVLFGLIWGCVYFTCIKKRYPLAFHVDLIVPSIFIGQILGRWGNFFNGEVFGTKVDRDTLWYVPKFIIDNATLANDNSMGGLANTGSQALAQYVNAPLFYIEGLINFVGFILIAVVLWNYWKKFRKPFQLGALYFVWYGVARLLLEPLRVEEFIMTRPIFGHEVATSKLMSIIFICIGVIGFIVSAIVYRKMPYEKIYVNEAAEEQERFLKEQHDAELMSMIEEKKAEIRARKVKEKEQSNG